MPRDAISLSRSELPEEIEAAIDAYGSAEADSFDLSLSPRKRGLAATRAAETRSALTAAILSRLGEAEARRWQPIETAPKAWRDETGRGRYVWLVARYPGSPSWTDHYFSWRDPDGQWVRWPHYFPPTHWMDAPKPPALSEAPSQGEQ